MLYFVVLNLWRSAIIVSKNGYITSVGETLTEYIVRSHARFKILDNGPGRGAYIKRPAPRTRKEQMLT